MSRTSLETRVAAGAATAVVGPHAAALVDVDADDPRADPLLAAIESGGGLTEILEALALIGFGDLPAFGVIVDTERGLRAFTRGTVRVHVEAAAPLDPSALSATNLETWREVLIPGARSWELVIEDAERPADDPVREAVLFDRGIVDASRMLGVVRDADPDLDLDADIGTVTDEPHDEVDSEDPADPVTVPEPAVEADDGDPVVPEAAPVPSGPMIDAVFCPAGHPSRPGDPSCITCDAPIEDPTVHRIARPPIALLFWDSGLEMPLDGPVLIGRNPGPGEEIDGEAARPVRIADPDAVLSREHLEVRPNGWDVVLIDRGSRNFTVLERPDGEPERLEANVPVRAPMGAEVVLAESAVFRIDPPL